VYDYTPYKEKDVTVMTLSAYQLSSKTSIYIADQLHVAINTTKYKSFKNRAL